MSQSRFQKDKIFPVKIQHPQALQANITYNLQLGSFKKSVLITFMQLQWLVWIEVLNILSIILLRLDHMSLFPLWLWCRLRCRFQHSVRFLWPAKARWPALVDSFRGHVHLDVLLIQIWCFPPLHTSAWLLGCIQLTMGCLFRFPLLPLWSYFDRTWWDDELQILWWQHFLQTQSNKQSLPQYVLRPAAPQIA